MLSTSTLHDLSIKFNVFLMIMPIDQLIAAFTFVIYTNQKCVLTPSLRDNVDIL